MPQLSLLQSIPPMTGLAIHLRAPVPGSNPHTQISVGVATSYGDTRTVFASTVPGLETDFLDTYAQEAVMAWAYGEQPSDVKRMLHAVKKQARAHRRGYGSF